jgi:hypothetical protein
MERRIRSGVIFSITLGLGILAIIYTPQPFLTWIAAWQIGSWTGDLSRWLNKKFDVTKDDEV